MKVSFKGLSEKFILFFAIVGLAVIGLSLFLVSQSSGIKTMTTQLETVRYPLNETLEGIRNNVHSISLRLIESSHQRDTAELTPAWVELSVALDGVEQQKQYLTSSLVDSVQIQVLDWQETGDDINRWIVSNYLNASTDSAFLAERPSREQSELLPRIDDFQQRADQIDGILMTLQNENLSALKEDISAVQRASARASVITLIIGLSLVVLIAAGGYYLVMRFKRSLTLPNEVINKLVNGETPEHIQPTEDELGKILEASNRLSDNLRRASEFARSIGEGDVNFQFQPVSDEDILGNALVQMRDKLRAIDEEDRKQSWGTEGLAKFADIMRRNDDYQALSDTIISELVKYTKSNQGGIFITNDDESDPYLELTACYAFERKKYLTRRVDFGDGLVGQCYLEKRTIYIEEIPDDYVYITSGLGSANPKSLLLVPLKVNDVVEGVVELASFRKYEPHEISFVEKVGEIVASMISNARVNDRTKKLLEESQQQSEEMRAQEEEMRQNMEEMQATQEQVQRQADEMRKIQESLELEKVMFHALMEFLPDRITYKDLQSRITRINKAKAVRMNIGLEEVIGKSDYDFFTKEHADRAVAEERRIIESGEPKMNVEEKFTLLGSDEVNWASTSRIPLKDERGKAIGVFIITKDITELKRAQSSLKDREKIIGRLLDDMKVFRYNINKEGVISHVWRARAFKEFDVNLLESRKVEDVLPEVYDLIQQEADLDTSLVCKGVLEINEEKEIFQHFLFKDSARDGFFLGFAIKQ